MLVAGFDPGSIRFGVGILKKNGRKISYIHSEEISLKNADFNEKMRVLWESLGSIYSAFPIESAAIEEGFLGKNVKSMNTLAKVRGVVLGSLIHQNIELTSYSPRAVKLAVTGNGNALKSQLNKALTMLLGLKDKKLGNDESDALATAYCHLLHVR